jgi:CDP-diacylglycerol--glycerol-3-phosphate 3-phosphatidyltransferase
MYTYTRLMGRGGNWLLDRVVGALAATGLHPNFWTGLVLVVNIWAAVLFAAHRFRWAAVVILLAGLVDLTDGPIARRQGRATTFGAFFDSIIGRYSDMVVYMGIIIYYASIGRYFYVVLTAVAMMSSFIVSYSQARAESLIPACTVGIMERPERMALLILGGLFQRLAPALWVIAVFSTWTVIHRIIFTWQETAAGRSIGVGPPGAGRTLTHAPGRR